MASEPVNMLDTYDWHATACAMLCKVARILTLRNQGRSGQSMQGRRSVTGSLVLKDPFC